MTKKISPQEFLDSTEFNYLTADCIEGNRHLNAQLYKDKPQNVAYDIRDSIWVCRNSKLVSDEKRNYIDWAGFDCTKPLARTGLKHD